ELGDTPRPVDVAGLPRACECRDHAERADGTDAEVAEVANVNSAVEAGSDGVRIVELGSRTGAVQIAGDARTCHIDDQAAGDYAADALIAGIGNVDHAVAVDREAEWAGEVRDKRRTVLVSRLAAAGINAESRGRQGKSDRNSFFCPGSTG